MRLNKNTLYILLHLLGGDTTVTAISRKMPEVTVRSIQRALERLTELRLAERSGPKNNPSYSIDYASLVTSEIPHKILEDENRPESVFNHGLIDWFSKIPTSQLEQQLGTWES